MKKTNGNRFQKGFPDRYIFQKGMGQKWIDYKAPLRNCFTIAQQKEWPEWDEGGVGIWIMTEASDEEYRKLFGPPNWREFWKPRYGQLDVDALLREAA